MKRRLHHRVLLVSVTIALSLACNAQQPSRPVKLPSGHVVRVLETGPINFSQAPPALMVKYETDLKVSDTEALRKEADEVFAILKIDAENGKFTSAVVSANEKPTGLILKSSHGYNFVYEKRADGKWHCLDDDKRSDRSMH